MASDRTGRTDSKKKDARYPRRMFFETTADAGVG